MRRLARPIRPCDSILIGQNPTRADTSGALKRAARSGWRTAQFLGTASPRTKMTTISKTTATATPQAPNHWAARMPTRVATTSWQTSTTRRTGLRKPWGFSVSRTRSRAPRWPSSARPIALARLMRTRLVSARARTADAKQQEDNDDEQGDVHRSERPGGDEAQLPVMDRAGGSGRGAVAPAAPCVLPPHRRHGPCPADGGCRARRAGRPRHRRSPRGRPRCGRPPSGR